MIPWGYLQDPNLADILEGTNWDDPPSIDQCLRRGSDLGSARYFPLPGCNKFADKRRHGC